MTPESFLSHYGITENPFGAEEARHDPVFGRLMDSKAFHPDFAKVLGRIDRPSTSVVFGEKGSGKTAIRILIGQRVAEHNARNPEHRTLLVAYDELNPVLDRVLHHRRGEVGFHRSAKMSIDQMLQGIRLEDHQDAILSLAVTRVVDALMQQGGDGEAMMLLPERIKKRLKKLPRQLRVDLTVLAALYDQPRSGSVVQRWRALRSRLRLGWLPRLALVKLGGGCAAVVAAGLWACGYWVPENELFKPSAGLAAAAAIVLLGVWSWRSLKLWLLGRKITREVLAVDRTGKDLRLMLSDLRTAERANQPWPISGLIPGVSGNQDSRYELTRRLLEVLGALGYSGMMVLMDRVDEPTVVNGQAQRMRSVVWPMLDNKFLQQARVGFKMLLPVELRHLLHRETVNFFQEARLDKQNMIDRLTWSGATLYDLCTNRLRACRSKGGDRGQAQGSGGAMEAEAVPGAIPGVIPGAGAIHLTDLFDQDVTRDMIVDALDQMHQPRDAFKFLYAVLQEHCRIVPEDEAVYKVPRLTLESVRRLQSQRVQELYRGLTPA